ncbi:MAG: NAD(P)-dependent oxidoreductase [Flavobacteriales bacterium]|nr:NAD(P)-dependent oxidoreductase [Flavobacteriales bacterium]
MHRILLTGSNGLLGQKLVALLRNQSEVELLATSLGENRISSTQGYSYTPLDITSREAVHEIFSSFSPTAVINTAAMTLVDQCESEVEKCRSINVDGVKNLLSACLEHGVHLQQVSTDFVFNGKDGPYRETDDPDPLSVYAQSKYDAEQAIIRSAHTDWSIARTIILYGVGENMSRSNIVLWARQTLAEGGDMKIVHDQFRAPTLAEDLALGCWAIIEQGCTGIYHLAGPETMAVIDIVKRIGQYYGFPTEHIQEIDTASLGQPAARPPHTGFILDKARRDLDYRPRTLEEGLALIDEQLPL